MPAWTCTTRPGSHKNWAAFANAGRPAASLTRPASMLARPSTVQQPGSRYNLPCYSARQVAQSNACPFTGGLYLPPFSQCAATTRPTAFSVKDIIASLDSFAGNKEKTASVIVPEEGMCFGSWFDACRWKLVTAAEVSFCVRSLPFGVF